MWSSDDPLKRLRIASPCQAKWENMAGDDRIRRCSSCNLHVYNFAKMARSEIAELLMTAEGRICARLYQRADGTLLTSDCPSGRAPRRRRFRLRTAALAALIGLSLASACTTSTKVRLKNRSSRMKLQVERVAIMQEAGFVGVVRDEDGVPLPGVTVVVRDHTTGKEITAITDVSGAFAITLVRDGGYRIEVALVGLEPMVAEHVELKRNDMTRAQVTLRFDQSATITVGALAIDSLMTNDGLGMTFSQEFLNKLPIGN